MSPTALAAPEVVGDGSPSAAEAGARSETGPVRGIRMPRSTASVLARSVLAALAVVALSFTTFLVIGSRLSEQAAQSDRFAQIRGRLALGTAPVGPTDDHGRLLPLGTPIAVIRIPALGRHQVIGEGTTSAALESGPGHLRSTVFPGGAGTSVIFGRAASYGGPFHGITKLRRGDEIVVTTGVGRARFRVVDVRYAGDPIPPLRSGRARLTLVTATGRSFLPDGVVSVDADGSGKALAAASPVMRSVPASEQPLGTDTSSTWALVLWLELLVVVVAAGVWLWHRRSPAHAWLLCFAPLLWVGTEVARAGTRLLPNLL
jgi:hypothetical protein